MTQVDLVIAVTMAFDWRKVFKISRISDNDQVLLVVKNKRARASFPINHFPVTFVVQ